MNTWNRYKVIVAVGFSLGLLLNGCSQGDADAAGSPGGHEHAVGTKYVCPMMCIPPSDKPGNCPVCGMKLEPAETGGNEGGPPSLALSERSRKLASVRVAPVERKVVHAEVRMAGKVEFDETRLAYVTTRVGGRLDRLYADFTGMKVSEGDHLVYLYSPDLLSAQEELVQGLKAEDAVTIEAARERLRLWGVTPEQIAEVERVRKGSDHMTIYAPISGVIIGKDAVEGLYVKTGTRIYTIADLSHLWVKLDAYEMDVGMISHGDTVSLTTESHPGRRFKGTVAFIDPVLDEKTRTIKVRVNAPNDDGALKPGMFVRAVVLARLAADGSPVGPDLSGKYMCPMHPDVVSDGPGRCPICQMDLVTAEKAGYSKGTAVGEPPLVIPVTAPLVTGKRAVVYVEKDSGEYEGREVTLGPRAGDYYVVRAGLSESEKVVVNGNFKIDSALQILAKPSMMQPPGHDNGMQGPATKEQPTGSPHLRHTAAGKPQTLCPVMGGAINKAVYADHDGYRVYFCCPGCDATFRKTPDTIIKRMQEEGIDVARVPEE